LFNGEALHYCGGPDGRAACWKSRRHVGTPSRHQYVVTVYALKIVLPTIPTHGEFVPFPEALYQAMIAAARNGDILDSASITGYFPGN